MKKGMKKLIALLCAGMCLFSVGGCFGNDEDENHNNNGGGNNNGGNNSTQTPTEDEDEIEEGEKIEVELYKEPYVIEVAKSGGDFTNLADALERVKSLQTDEDIAKTSDSILIKLSAGRHLVEETIEIDADIATGNLPIVIEGATDGETILDGGKVVQGGWTAHKDGIYKTQVSGVNAFRQLYVNGAVGTRSRYPNDTGNLTNDYMPLTWNETDSTVGIPSYVKGDFSQKALQEAELHFVQEWTQSVGHIWDKNWIEKDDVLYFGFQEDWFTKMVFRREYPVRNKKGANKCWLENSLEFVDVENEWYFDASTSTLYYKPKAGVDINSLTFEIPQTESIIQILGTPEKVAKGVSLSNLTIANTNWDYVSKTGYIDGQAGLYYTSTSSTFDAKSPSAGILTVYAQDITIDNCHVQNMGAYGVDFYVGTKNVQLINSTIEKTAGSGVNIGTYGETMLEKFDGYVTNAATPSTQEEIAENITVHNNLIQHVGISFKGGSTGIVAGFARKLRLEQNTITDVSYSGIAVGWGWERYNSVLCNIQINRNHITDTMNHLPFDGGGIYLLGKHVDTLEGSEIQGNYIEASGLGGIYFDNSSSSYVTKNNVIKGEAIKGIIDLHDWDYLLHDITVTRTYSDLQYPELGVYRHHYWSETGKPTDDAPSPEGRGVFFEPHIYAYAGGKWNEEAQMIIDFAGQIK